VSTCKKCLMISSLQNSNFNSEGECYWCQTNFPNYKPRGEEKLADLLNEHRSKSSSADCMVGVSGGKDSTYALMALKDTYGLNVEAFTYVHEGTVPASVENAKKMCMKLDVKHHIVSLPDQIHLRTFKTFFRSWLAHPSLVSAGMTCVACKHLHILGFELAKERNIPMIAWASTPLECPPFLAIGYKGNNGEVYQKSSLLENAANMMKEMVHSPKFVQGVVEHFSTCYQGCMAVSPASNYLIAKYPTVTPIKIFDFIDWNPRVVIDEITRKGWQKPVKSGDDWHSDCLFHHFKEYMFRKMLGVSYLEAYLSNQIRYGLLSRDEAMKSVEENKRIFLKEFPIAIKELEMDDIADKIDYQPWQSSGDE